MQIAKRFLLILLACLPVACVLPVLTSAPTATPAAVSGGPFLIEAPANATSTATPFQPLPPTPTYIPTNFPTLTQTPVPTLTPTPLPSATATLKPTRKPTKAPRIDIQKTWSDYPGPTLWPDIEIPGPMGILDQPGGQINILLLGSDKRPNDAGFRTDTIILLTLNPRTGEINLTSYPRDLYVYIPGWTVQRINTAFQYGGFESLALTFEYNFGVRPNYYVLINFWSFRHIIDSLGGIDVQVGKTLTDQRTGHGNFTVRAGKRHMDGEMALWYVRSRYSTSDFDRTQRQQEVLRAIFIKLLSLDGVSRAPELFKTYRENVTTNLTLKNITPLLPMAASFTRKSQIQAYFIGREQVIAWVTSSGAQVLLPIREEVKKVMREALNSRLK
jgi:LCP family protein required for cell wall assembly